MVVTPFFTNYRSLQVDLYYLQYLNHQMTEISLKTIRWVNIITAVTIIAFGLAGAIFLGISNLLSGQFFLIFSPIYMIIFGVILFATELDFDFILKRVGILRTLVGRGIFNIYLSSQVFYYFACSSANVLLAWLFGMILFGEGVLYLLLHYCAGSAYAESIRGKLQNKY